MTVSFRRCEITCKATTIGKHIRFNFNERSINNFFIIKPMSVKTEGREFTIKSQRYVLFLSCTNSRCPASGAGRAQHARRLSRRTHVLRLFWAADGGHNIERARSGSLELPVCHQPAVPRDLNTQYTIDAFNTFSRSTTIVYSAASCKRHIPTLHHQRSTNNAHIIKQKQFK